MVPMAVLVPGPASAYHHRMSTEISASNTIIAGIHEERASSRESISVGVAGDSGNSIKCMYMYVYACVRVPLL